MEAIKDTLQNLMQAWEVKRQRGSPEAPYFLLKKMFSKKELAHVKFDNLRKGVLSIYVDSSAWLYHLSLHKEGLLVKLEKQSGQIKDIRFYLGETGEKERSQG